MKTQDKHHCRTVGTDFTNLGALGLETGSGFRSPVGKVFHERSSHSKANGFNSGTGIG